MPQLRLLQAPRKGRSLLFHPVSQVWDTDEGRELLVSVVGGRVLRGSPGALRPIRCPWTRLATEWIINDGASSMKIAVSTNGNDLDSPFVPVFGRCPVYLIVDTDTMGFEAITNDAAMAAGGAGIQAAQDVARRGIGAVITGNIGPNAYRVLAAAGLPVYTFSGSTVRQAVEAFKAGRLSATTDATAPAHAGMGAMRGMCRSLGGGGRGMGGRGGMGFSTPGAQPGASPRPPAAPDRSDDLSSLKAEVQSLRERLGEIADRIDNVR